MFSIKQTGVPLGTAIAGAAVPALVLALGWQGAALAIGAACALLRRRARAGARALRRCAQPGGAGVAARPRSRRWVSSCATGELLELSLVSFVYGGMQITLIAYLVTFLVESFALSLVLAGMVMAASQLASVAARIAWGAFADRVAHAARDARPARHRHGRRPRRCALAAGPDWPLWVLFAFAMAFGATAVGWNGVFLAEIARLAPRGSHQRRHRRLGIFYLPRRGGDAAAVPPGAAA